MQRAALDSGVRNAPARSDNAAARQKRPRLNRNSTLPSQAFASLGLFAGLRPAHRNTNLRSTDTPVSSDYMTYTND